MIFMGIELKFGGVSWKVYIDYGEGINALGINTFLFAVFFSICECENSNECICHC